ncbi:SH3 domain-containing protein [Mesorhizobium sp.]|uniref:SH3 domain-containing protein n=1 Tax=Mesorhizobium sp. TaxID=1871066 RepID=UPI0025EF7811|nr:SH3 domain-containing protein [Mesorhizobium sp.]
MIVAPLLAAALPAIAEESPSPAVATAPIISVVSGLAPDDLLNIRATASAIGKTEARLPSGTAVKNYGCNTFNGYPWCKVEDAKNPNVVGWAPARYLTPNNPATVPEDQLAPAPQANAGQASANPPADEAGKVADVAAPEQAPVSPPSDLSARLGAAGHAAPPSVATITGNAMQDAVGLAFAANDNPAAGEIPASDAKAAQPVDPTSPADEQAQQTEPAAADTSSAAANVPVPTPRPDEAGNAPAAKAETVARLEPPPAQATSIGPDGMGEIPCARYVGQPMTRCTVKVVHGNDGKADVTVNWPDGGTRVISFHSGQPAGADSRGEFRFTREGNLNMIRVGVSERFEITDALALGE